MAINALLGNKGLHFLLGSIVDATIIPAASSSKNAQGRARPGDSPDQKGNQWFFGMKAHIGLDPGSGLLHTVTTTAARSRRVNQVAELLHGKEEQVWVDSGYRGVPSRLDRDDLQWHLAASPSNFARLP